MSFFYNTSLNLVLVIFPILVYFILKIYLFNNDKKDNSYFIVTTIISVLLLFIFSNISFLELSIVIFVPLLFNYIKGNKLFSILISLFMIIINNYFFEINIYILLIEYIIYFLTYIRLCKKNIVIINFINKFIIIRSFFLSFYVFSLYYNNNFNLNVIYLIFSIVTSYFLSFTYYYLLNKKISMQEIDNISKKLENQENIRNYLCAVTHELKNSLCISKGYLDMMNNTNKKDDYLRIVRKEINRSIEMIQDGLNFSKDKTNYEILDINVLLEDVTDTLEELFKKKNIKYRVNYIDDDIYILGDYEKLKQVMINILKNSVEARDENLKIEIDNHIIKNEICISIKDNGCGIKDLNEIGKGYSNKYHGMGIGTTFSKNVIDKHNGKIIYESTKDEGTTVNILLPLFK